MSLGDQISPGARSTTADGACERILGISFFNGTAEGAAARFMQKAGYLVAPASPALLKLSHDEEYRRALQQADLAIADSELLVVVWRLATGRKLRKISGLSYLRCLLEHGISKRGRVFWVVSSESAKEKALRWLTEKGVPVEERDFYVATNRETKTEDYALLTEIEKRQPLDIIIAISAGVQERL